MEAVECVVLLFGAAYTLLLLAIKLGFFCRAISWLVMAAMALLAVVLFWAVAKVYAQGLGREWGFSRKFAVVGSMLFLAGVLAVYWLLPPQGSENLLGSTDEGIYACTALHVQRARCLEIDASFVRLVPERWRCLVQAQRPATATLGEIHPRDYPYYDCGFRYVGETRLAPHFPPGYPALLAAWLDLWGLKNIGLLNRFLGGLSALALAVVAGRGWGWRAAWTVLPLMLFIPLQFWICRTQFAEVLLQLLWLLPIFILGSKRQNSLGCLGAGFVCGLLPSVKLDALLAVAVAVVVLIQLKGLKMKGCGLLGLFSGLLLALWSGWPGTAPYIQDTAGALSLGYGNAIVFVACGVVLVGLAWACGRAELLREWGSRFRPYRQVVVLGAAGLIFAYAYWVRPVWQSPSLEYFWPMHHTLRTFNEENMVRLGWYFTLPGLFVACMGLVMVVQRCRRPYQWMLVGVGVLSLVLLTARINCNPLQPYAMRRYIPLAVPVLILGLAMFPALWGRTFCGRRGRWIVLWPVLWLAVMLPGWRQIAPVSDLKGFPGALQEMVAALPERSFLLVTGDVLQKRLKMPLFVGFGVPAVEVDGAADQNKYRELISALQRGGYQVFLLNTEQVIAGIELPALRHKTFTKVFDMESPVFTYSRPDGAMSCQTYRWSLSVLP